jgi:hypothetical protein
MAPLALSLKAFLRNLHVLGGVRKVFLQFRRFRDLLVIFDDLLRVTCFCS